MKRYRRSRPSRKDVAPTLMAAIPAATLACGAGGAKAAQTSTQPSIYYYLLRYIKDLYEHSKLSKSHEINTSGHGCNWQISKKAVRSTALSMLSSRLTRTDAGDHQSRGRYLKPDRRNGSAERKTSRSRCRPWRHKGRCRARAPEAA